jgi:hypothetical protein
MLRERFPVTPVRIAVGLCFATLVGGSALAAEPPKGLVLHFSFDQADTGGVIADRSGQNNNGRASDAKWVPSGKQGGGSEFASSGSQIRVASSESLNVKRVTLAVWFRTAKLDAIWRRLLDQRAEHGYDLSLGGDAKDVQSRGKLAFAIDGGPPCLSDNVVADGTWHHGAATFDGENLRLYVDGQPQKQVLPCRADISAHAGDLTIGMSTSSPSPPVSGQSFEGVIDEVMIFNRALSADEIKALVAAVDPSAGKFKFSKQQVAGRLRQLKQLYEDGLLTDEFYLRKVAECEAAR